MENFSKNKSEIEPCNSNCSFCFLNYANILEKNYLFKNLSPDEIGQIIRDIHHQVKSYKKGELIASSGEQYNNLYIIVDGGVVGELIDFEGRIIRIEELHAPDTVASAFIFGQNNALPVNITATEATRILSIPRQDLLKLFGKNERVLHNYLDIMANRAQHLSKKIKLLGLQTIRGKIAYYLLELVKKAGTLDLILPNTQNEIAEMFGTTRPSIGRAMREMHSQGIIEARGRKVRIKDNAALSALLR